MLITMHMHDFKYYFYISNGSYLQCKCAHVVILAKISSKFKMFVREKNKHSGLGNSAFKVSVFSQLYSHALGYRFFISMETQKPSWIFPPKGLGRLRLGNKKPGNNETKRSSMRTNRRISIQVRSSEI